MTETLPTGFLEVRAWVLSRNPGLDSVGQDEDLIAARLVDSLTFVELVYVIEGASGVEIDFDTIDIEDFRTLGAIEKAFFGHATP
ncbi:holo [Amycolatopsis coloradensis]|uniref:Holo n=1 Tax=Amycolatopsis coloradensis TaxID=76021 RepID=A0A1R0KEA9_9PSEU|nr:holo [Amycolatopsis coloradensis]OLZ43389.1 holo [Amycolatopsis coloradensis]